jgi:hypothetical protein
MNVTLKNVPDGAYRTVEAAADGGRLRLGEMRKELDRFAASLPPLDDSAPLIRRERLR